MDQEYHGWINWETWNAFTCLTEEEYLRCTALATKERDRSLLGALLQPVISSGQHRMTAQEVDRINWSELADALLEP